MSTQQPASPCADSAITHLSDKDLPRRQSRTGEEEEDPSIQQTADEPNTETDQSVPDGGYGWVCVACAFLIYAHSWGLASSYGVFLAHYKAHDVFPGASRIGYAFVGGLAISCCCAAAPLANRLSHHLTTRATVLVGVCVQCGALLGASFATRQWHMMLSQGAGLGVGIGLQFVPVAATVPQWFAARRGLAHALTVGGAGVGGCAYALAAQRMLATLSLQGTFWVLCGVSTAVNAACALLVRDRNRATGANLARPEWTLLRRGDVLLLLAWSVFSMLGYVALMFSVPSYAQAVGASVEQGALAGAIFNLGQGIGRPAVGLASDRCGRVAVAAGTTLACAVLCLVMGAAARRFAVVCALSFFAGATGGSFWATVVPVAAELVPLASVPSLSSFVWLSIVAPTLVSEAVALVLAEREVAGRPYFSVLVFISCTYLVASGCLFLLLPACRSTRQRICKRRGSKC